MSKANLLEIAANLADYDVNAAKLLINLEQSETGSDITQALEKYDLESSALLI
jgi:hypothetical protein